MDNLERELTVKAKQPITLQPSPMTTSCVTERIRLLMQAVEINIL